MTRVDFRIACWVIIALLTTSGAALAGQIAVAVGEGNSLALSSNGMV